MILVIVANIALVTVVVTAVIGLLTRSILTSHQPQLSESVTVGRSRQQHARHRGVGPRSARLQPQL